MSDDVVLRADQQGVAVLTFNRPERRNAWTVGLQRRYYELLAECVEDPDVRCIVVTGSGSSFCPGADTDSLQTYSDTGEFNPEAALIVQPDWYPITVLKPMVAAINGACAGFGLVQTMFCDVRIAASGVRMSTAFARRGLPALHASAWLLPRLIGGSRASELLVSGRTFTSDEAAIIGLVHQLAEQDEVLDKSIAYARDIAENCSLASIANIKAQLRDSYESSFSDSVAVAEKLEHRALGSVDFHEGVMSFVERRQPSFAAFGAGSAARPKDGAQ
ncbi:enoyl-CoA hydratase-related protein [Angustibacter sp. McL0619]|uniref:enoyl-CoA hydratase-related protein n=1 Tax=Angustibacter sp. McL0619 TaxID=3415676 RepID=UPI003CEB1019